MSSESFRNPVLFACGVPRSGTTLLQRMLNSHPSLAVVNDSHFIPRALQKTDPRLIGKVLSGETVSLTKLLTKNVFHYHRFYRTGITWPEFDHVAGHASTYSQLVSELYALYARKHNKTWAGEKTPDYVRHVELLNRLFPGAKIIHLIRDGRDVALSLLQWATPTKGPGRLELWKTNPVATCALWWQWMVQSARQQAAQIDARNYMEVRYESLVEDPETVMRSICRFVQLDYSKKMLDFHRGNVREAGHLSAKSAWLPPRSGLRNWRTQMSTSDVETFEAIASEGLEAYDYEISIREFSSQVMDSARRCHRWWADHFLPKTGTSIPRPLACETAHGASAEDMHS